MEFLKAMNPTLHPNRLSNHFYRSVLFFLGLNTIVGFGLSLLYVQAGVSLFTLHSYATLFLVGALLSLVLQGLLLQYYCQQQYRVIYITGLLYGIIYFIRAGLVYIRLVPLTTAFDSYHIPVSCIEIALGLVYAVSLLRSQPSKHPWLKAAGTFFLILKLVSLCIFLWWLPDHSIQANPAFIRADQWISFIGNLLPLLFMFHFSQQQAQTKSVQSEADPSTWQETLLDATKLIAIGALLFLSVSVFSEAPRADEGSSKAKHLAQMFEARTFRNDQGGTLQYLLLKPLNYDATKSYPLMVCLHGGSGNGNDNTRQLDGSWEAGQLSRPENRKKYPAFLLVPQCPPGASWGGIPDLVAKDSLVFEIMNSLEKEFSIDTCRRYIGGASLGGYGTWHFIGTRSGVFAAAIPVCGAGSPALAKQMADVSIWAFHGEKDRIVPVEGSRAVITAIRKLGAHPRYTEFAGLGHNDIWPRFDERQDVWAWLFAQKRRNSPN